MWNHRDSIVQAVRDVEYPPVPLPAILTLAVPVTVPCSTEGNSCGSDHQSAGICAFGETRSHHGHRLNPRHHTLGNAQVNTQHGTLFHHASAGLNRAV